MTKEKICGIYKITSPSGKIYIGQSKDIKKRWSYYKKLHCKAQVKLYNSFKKYGVALHAFDVLKECDSKELNRLEIHYINLFNTFNTENGLNLNGGGLAAEYVSEETRIKQGNSMRGIKSRVSASRFVGVFRGKKQGRWVSKICIMGKTYHLGTFDTEILASEEYLKATECIINNTFKNYYDRIKYTKSSKFNGVSFDSNKNKWVASITNNGRQVHLGRFNSEIEAFDCVSQAVKNTGLKTFDKYIKSIRRKRSSSFEGVYLDKNLSRWRVDVKFKGNRLFLGNFDTEDIAIKKLNEANFHISEGTFSDYYIGIKPKYASRIVGVGWHSRDKKWTATVTIKGKRKSLGYFNSEQAAANIISEFRKMNPKNQ